MLLCLNIKKLRNFKWIFNVSLSFDWIADYKPTRADWWSRLEIQKIINFSKLRTVLSPVNVALLMRAVVTGYSRCILFGSRTIVVQCSTAFWSVCLTNILRYLNKRKCNFASASKFYCTFQTWSIERNFEPQVKLNTQACFGIRTSTI